MKNDKKQNDLKKTLLSWKNTWRIQKKLLALLWQRRPRLLTASISLSIWQALSPYIGIYLAALIVEELTGSPDSGKLMGLVSAALLSAAAISLATACLNRAKAIEMADWYHDIQKMLDEKLLDMDYCILDDPKTMQDFSTIQQNQNGGGWGIARSLSLLEELFSAIFTLLGGLSLTVTLFTCKVPDGTGWLTMLNSPLLPILIIGALLALTYAETKLSNKADSYFVANHGTHNLVNRLFSYFGFLGKDEKIAPDIRLYRQDLLCQKYNRDKTIGFASKGPYARMARGLVGFYSSTSSAISGLFSGIVYLFVCLKAWAGAFGIGMATQYIGSFTMLAGGFSSLLSIVGLMRMNASFVESFLDFLEKPNVMYQGSLTVEKRRDRQYEVEFRDVSFLYPGSPKYALRHVDMKFTVGGRLAVVGQNGSGKTTFIKLLCRLYDPTEGSILLNGIDIRKYDYKEYISLFSVVFQDFALTDFPLGQNVASAATYNDSLARGCLQKAGFGHRLANLPKGLDTYLTKSLDEEGVDMSGGERQKIALARALYKDSPFIVLDEPTAALDPMAEAEIYSNFNAIIEDKTAIFISHRLSSCKFCDDILVFDGGEVVQQGSHDILVADADGKYRQLWQAQAQYYDDANAHATNQIGVELI